MIEPEYCFSNCRPRQGNYLTERGARKLVSLSFSFPSLGTSALFYDFSFRADPCSGLFFLVSWTWTSRRVHGEVASATERWSQMSPCVVTFRRLHLGHPTEQQYQGRKVLCVTRDVDIAVLVGWRHVLELRWLEIRIQNRSSAATCDEVTSIQTGVYSLVIVAGESLSASRSLVPKLMPFYLT